MAEVVGLVASVLQLITTIASSVALIRDLHNAPTEHLQLFSEIQSLQLLVTALQGRINTHPSTPGTGLDGLQDTLVQLQETMGNCNRKLQPDGTMVRAISWTLWKKVEAKEDLVKIERFKTLLNSWLMMDIWDAGHQRITNNNDQRQDHYRILTSMSEIGQQQHTYNNEQRQDHYRILTSVQGFVNQQEDRHSATERSKIIEWLSPLNSFQRQLDIFGTLQPGTGEWLLAHTQYKKWEDGASEVLWCRGIPGAGKTVLTSLVVHHLEAREDNIGVAWVYLNHKETDTQTPDNILGSFLKQLAHGLGSIPTTVQELYLYHCGRQTRPSSHELLETFPSIIAGYSKVHLIIDAFDEYREDQRHILANSLAAVRQRVNLMITSRPHLNLEALFPDIHILDIRAMDIDISRYVDMQISKSPRLSRHVQKQSILYNEIQTKISEGAAGMFLLTKLHMDLLAAKLTIKAVRAALQQLPQDLDRTYDEAMERINSQSPDEKELAHLVLIWVAKSRRPLSIQELQEALAIEPGSTSLDVDNLIDIDTIVSVCAGLVIVDNSKHDIRLIHYTVQNYLDTIQMEPFSTAHTEITLRSLTYLFFNEFVNLPDTYMGARKLIQDHPFLAYAEKCLFHALGEPEIALQDLVIKFVQQATRWRFIWSWGLPTGGMTTWSKLTGDKHETPLWTCAAFGLVATAKHLLADELFSGSQGCKNNALYIASEHGHLQMVQLLLKHGASIDAQGRSSGTALLGAALHGRYSVAQLLIEKGANLESHGGMYGTPLQTAAHTGRDSIIKLLVQSGASIDAQIGYFGCALQASAGRGNIRMVEFLIENGADVNAHGGKDNTALQAAASAGHNAMIQLLIEKGASVDALSGQDRTALQGSVLGGHHSTVELLIENGTDVNGIGPKGDTALQTAAFVGRDLLVQLLIEKGANVNAHGGEDGTALQIAAHKGNAYIAEILIDKGADVNAQFGLYGSALQNATAMKHYSLVQFLLERGADVNSPGGKYGTALHAAVQNKSFSVVRLIILAGADVNAEGGEAMQAAAYDANTEIMELLISYGADVNIRGGHYGTPLQAAINGGSHEMVEHLLLNGADPNGHGGASGTALQAAACQKSNSIVQLLIGMGANVNSQGGHFGTALQAATHYRSNSIVKLLLQKGADVNGNGGQFGTALQAAASIGDESLVQVLIKAGANVNAEGGEYGSPVQAAACNGSTSLVQILIAAGANVNIQNGVFGSALHAAAYKGDTSMVRLLIDMGADVNAKGGTYATALQAAARFGHRSTVSLLLEKGADVNVEGGRYGTALKAAAAGGHKSLIQLLAPLS